MKKLSSIEELRRLQETLSREKDPIASVCASA